MSDRFAALLTAGYDEFQSTARAIVEESATRAGVNVVAFGGIAWLDIILEILAAVGTQCGRNKPPEEIAKLLKAGDLRTRFAVRQTARRDFDLSVEKSTAAVATAVQLGQDLSEPQIVALYTRTRSEFDGMAI